MSAEKHEAFTLTGNRCHRHAGPYDAVVHGHVHLHGHSCISSRIFICTSSCISCHPNQLQAVLSQYLHIGKIGIQIPVAASRHSPHTTHGVVMVDVLGPYGDDAQGSCPCSFIIKGKADIIGQDNLSLKRTEPFFLFHAGQRAFVAHPIPDQLTLKPMGFAAVHSRNGLHGEIKLSRFLYTNRSLYRQASHKLIIMPFMFNPRCFQLLNQIIHGCFPGL